VEVVASPSDAQLADRVAADLLSMGVETKRTAAPESDIDLLAIARAGGVAAAVRIACVPGGVEVWVAERATGKTLMRVAAIASEDDAATLALRTVELLRASLIELNLPALAETSRGDASTEEVDALREAFAPADDALPASVRPAARAEPNTPSDTRTAHAQRRPPAAPDLEPSGSERQASLLGLSLEAGPAIVGSPGGLPPFAALHAAAGLRVSRPVRVGLFGIIPLQAMAHESNEASSDTRIHFVGFDARYEPFDGALRPSIAAQVSAVLASTEGQPRTPRYLYRADNAVAVSPSLRAGLGWSPHPHVTIRVDGSGGGLVRPFAVVYAEREVAEWGRAWFAGSLAIETEL